MLFSKKLRELIFCIAFAELFSTPLTPKTDEIVVYAGRDGKEESKKKFETMISKSFKEIFRVLKIIT